MARFTKALLALPVLMVSLGVLAAEPAVSSSTPAAGPAVSPALTGAMSSGIGTQLFQLVLGLLLVVGLIFVLAWLMRRVQRAGPAGNQVIELIGSKALGPRDRLVLVQVGNEQILLGVTPGRITPLHVMNEPVQIPESQQATPEFARRLMEVLGNKGLNKSGANTSVIDPTVKNRDQKDTH